MLNLDGLFQTGIVAITTGFGSAIGNFLAMRFFLKHLREAEKQ